MRPAAGSIVIGCSRPGIFGVRVSMASDGRAPAVDRDDGTGDVAGLVRREERDDLRDLLDLGRAPHQRGGAELFDPVRAGAVGVHGAGGDSVDAYPRGTELGGP